MKLKIENKQLTILEKEDIKTGNQNTYELEIEASEEYEKCACSVTFKIGNNYVRKEVVNNKITIPFLQEVPNFNRIYIGFFGTYVENGKTLEIYSANLDYLNVVQGSFKKYLQTDEDLNPTLLEQYLQEMKEYFKSSKQDFEASVTEAESDITTAKNGAVNTINSEKDAAISAIGTAKENALGELNDSKESAINEIEDLNSGLKTRVASLESGKVDKEAGKGLSDENYTSAEKSKLANLENYDDTSIRNSIQGIQSDLANFYRKTETYSKTEVDQMISVIPKFAIRVVDSLPTTEISTTTIYLVRTGTETDNVFTEYVYINGAWEKLGTQRLDLSGYSTTVEMNQAIASAIATLEASVNTALANKVDKVTGKGLSTNDYTNEEKQDLANTKTGLANLLADFEDYSSLESFLNRYCLLTQDGQVYGTHFEPFSVSHASTGTRTKSNIGKHMIPATDTTPEDTNLPDFLTKPLFTCNAVVDNEGNRTITAIKGDSNFQDTGAVDVYNAYRTVWLKHTVSDENGEDYEISDTPFEGASVIPAAINRDGSISPVFYVAKHQGTKVNGKLYSSKNGVPEKKCSYNNCVDFYHAKGNYYCAMTDAEYMFFQFLFVIMFADRNNETNLRGNTNYNLQYTVAYGENGVSRVILTTAQAGNIDLLTCVSVGNMGSATDKNRGYDYMHNVLNSVKVVGKEEIDSNYIALILDCDAVDIPENAVVSTMPERTGYSDLILGYTGSPVSNTNGKHGVVIAGTEMLTGAYETMGNEFVDIVAADFTRDIYNTNDASKVTKTVATAKNTYRKSTLQFKPVASTWKYITSMQYDLDLGISVFRSMGESGSGAATGYCDASTSDGTSSGQREMLRGGNLGDAGAAGLWCVALNRTLGSAYWNSCSRPSICALGVN